MLRNIQGVMALIAIFASYELIKFLFSFVSLKNAFVSNTSKCPPNRKQVFSSSLAITHITGKRFVEVW